MNVILVILGLLGVGVILLSVYVFMVAARSYVSSDDDLRRVLKSRTIVARNPSDRRSGRPVAFPLVVNGMIVLEDRRKLPDRRTPAMA